MRHFESPETFLRTFVKSYYTIAQSHPHDLQKFYSPDATILRQQRIQVPGAGREHLGIQNNRTLTIIDFGLTPIGPDFYVSVNGRISRHRAKIGFTQLFVLSEHDDRLWIVADTANRLTVDGPFNVFDAPEELKRAQPPQQALFPSMAGKRREGSDSDET
jgi:hypothetical protein